MDANSNNCQVPTLYLDSGVDAQTCEDWGLELSERGMRFCARWRFDVGAQMALDCVHAHPNFGPQKVTLEGIMVWCQRQSNGLFDTALLFLKLPEELKNGLRSFSMQLTLRV